MNNFYKDGTVHAYLKGIIKTIYTIKNKCSNHRVLPKYFVSENAVENTIAQATNDSSGSRYAFDEGSTIIRDKVETGFGLIRKSFGSSSTAVRQVSEGHSKRSRTAPEQDSNDSRVSLEVDSNNTRTGVEQSTRINAEFFLTKFAPSSRSLRVGSQWASSPLRRTCRESRSRLEAALSGGRTRLEERAKKGRRNAVKHQMDDLDQFLATDVQEEPRPAREHGCSCISQACVVHMLSNGLAWIVRKTVSVDILSMHFQRSIFASSILDRCLNNFLIQISAFKRFNLFKQGYRWFCINNSPNLFKSILNRSIASDIDAFVQRNHCKIMKAGRAFSLRVLMFFNLLDCVLTELKSIRTYSLLVLMVSMFSLSAQTPRKDSGADGLNKIKPLMVGDTIPEALWHLPLDVLNYAQGSQRIYLNNFRDKKLILLDFWTVWCVPCINKLKELSAQLNLLDENAIVVPVTKNNTSSAQHILKQNDVDLFTIYADSMLIRYFPHVSVPHQIWIKDGIVTYITDGNLTTVANINDFVMNKPVQLLQKESEIDHSDLNKLTISDTSQMIADNTIFSSSFTKAL